MLPGVDGFEICRNIREEKNIPVIMVSAKKDDIDKIRGLGLGADDYMTKPFSPSELVARVKAHLARYERLVGSGIQENEIIEIRGIKIDKTATTSLGQRRGEAVYIKGIRPSDFPGTESESCIYERRAVQQDLGYGVHWGYCNRDGAY